MHVGPFQLRPHQIAAVELLRSSIAKGNRFVLLLAPCGYGKTLVSSAIMSLALERGKLPMFLASGRQLIFQKSRKLTECGIPHSVLMAGEHYDPTERAIVSSKDTLWSRAFENNHLPIPEADVIIIDEAHTATGETWQRIIERYPKAVFIGLSATPALGNGKRLPFYQDMIRGATYEELIAGNYLVPPRVYAPFAVDMEGVDVNAANGEYVLGQVAKRFTDEALIGDVIKDWKRYAEDRTTACFCANVEHSIYVASQFNKHGIPAAHVDAETPQDERDAILKAAEERRIRVLCNFAVYTTGADFPWVECVQIVRAMNSLNTYLQTVGRGFRTHTFADGRVKQDCVIIDHGGCVHKHGWPTEDHDWSLSGETTVQQRDEKNKEAKPPAEKREITCPICGAVRQRGPQCHECGHKHTRDGAKVRMVNGDLKPLTRKKAKKTKQTSDDQRTWLMCMSIAANRGMSVNQARVLFNQKMRHWPPDEVGPMPDRHKWGLKVRDLYPNWGRKK